MSDWPGWEQAVLADIPAPDTAENVRFLEEWHTYEESSCTYNPLNTTKPWTNSRNCVQTGTGGVWVQAYRTSVDGAKATAATLNSPFYLSLLAALKSGDPYSWPAPQAVAQDIRTWGTPLYASFYLTQVDVTGTGAPPPSPSPSPTPTPSSGLAPRAHNGYNDLRGSIASRLPTALRDAQRIGQATSRALAAKRKVGR